jgi:FMN phosphatase YigB (HAD superfamily)
MENKYFDFFANMNMHLFIFDLDQTLVDWSQAKPELFPQVLDILDNLKSRGHKMAVASYNKRAPTVLKDFGLSQYFEMVEFESLDQQSRRLLMDVVDLEPGSAWEYRQLACDNKATMLETIVDRTRIPMEHCVFLDDNRRFVDAARKLGIYSIHVKGGLEWGHVLKALQYFGK